MHRLFGESRRRDPPLFSRLSLFSFPLLLFFLPPSLPLLFFASGHIGPSLSPRWLSLCRASAIAAIHQPRAIFAIIMEGWAESAAFSRSYCSFPPSSSFPKVEQTRVPFRCHSRRAFHLLVKGTFFIVEEGTFFNCGNARRKRRATVRHDFFREVGVGGNFEIVEIGSKDIRNWVEDVRFNL